MKLQKCNKKIYIGNIDIINDGPENDWQWPLSYQMKGREGNPINIKTENIPVFRTLFYNNVLLSQYDVR